MEAKKKPQTNKKQNNQTEIVFASDEQYMKVMSLRKKKIKESFDTELKRYIWSFSWFTKASSEMKTC